MNRYVIKGRGVNRGKYLCYARMAPELNPTDDGFIWLPEQRKAARWKDPRYSGRTWATDRASRHDGYFVKLLTPAAIKATVGELRTFIADRAKGANDPLPAHWVHGAGGLKHGVDEATDYCLECCRTKVTAILEKHPEEESNVCVDGGWDTDHDSIPFCETCGAKLDGTLTEYGADEEISALTTYAAPGFRDHGGWQDLDNAIMNLDDDDPRWRKISKIVHAARALEGGAP